MAELNVSLVVFREIDFLNVTNTYWDSDMLLDVFDVDEKQNILNKTKVIMIQYFRLFYTESGTKLNQTSSSGPHIA